MTVQIGIIGCGVMGADHCRLLHGEIFGAKLVAVQDSDRPRAALVAASAGDVRIHDFAHDLIADRDIDAVVIASPDHTHAALATACVEAGKPVLCEKPLAATIEECQAVMTMEMTGGRRLVQVGYMRRFDPGLPRYEAQPRRPAVRPPAVPALRPQKRCRAALHHFRLGHREFFGPRDRHRALPARRGICSGDSDQRQILPACRNAAASVHRPGIGERRHCDGRGVSRRPIRLRCSSELVCEDGTVSLAPNPPVSRRHAHREGFEIDGDWRARFADAYRDQLKEWVASIEDGRPVGSSAWDGYAASATAAAALEALAAGGKTATNLGERPAFYAG